MPFQCDILATCPRNLLRQSVAMVREKLELIDVSTLRSHRSEIVGLAELVYRLYLAPSPMLYPGVEPNTFSGTESLSRHRWISLSSESESALFNASFYLHCSPKASKTTEFFTWKHNYVDSVVRVVVANMDAQSAKSSGKPNQVPTIPQDYIEAQLASGSGSAPRYNTSPF